ncbi:prephenate dehydrogenase [Tamaricihabitans halophyticus]|uniref:Prephenate dehydrogenase n=1 Tax=Tamaricihabitans halophyticus TaxID=1262583 RepID=A0A4R2RB77_9PSEU|nr:prephenate dehydrogenase [Tamaricihabitans halophyticus]TCP56961.1 prephenate dehydrogenase [Tamaricihabitans halophyticus]
MRAICVLGLGLIGGSVLRAARAAGLPAWGAADVADAEAASSAGYTATADLGEALRRAREEDALVVLAVPLFAVDDVLRQVAEHAPRCLLTDVVSVKEPVANSVRRIVPAANYVGGHPMSGTAESGWSASSAELFHGAAWVATVDETSDLAVWREVAALALACGAEVVPVAGAEHDAAVARISHLPHLLAAVLASVGAAGGPLALSLAAGSFADGTRVAGSDPELVRAMCEGNGTALLSVVDDALGKLGAARGALASTGSLGATIGEGHRGRRAFDAARQARSAQLRIDLGAPGAHAALAALGSQGGRITAVDGTTAFGQVPAADPAP